MESVIDILNGWQLKIIFSTLFALFYPFKLTLLILVIVIILNILTEIFYDIKIKKIRISKLNKIILKIITYFIAIAAVRFFEGSIGNIYDTTLVTQFMISLLTLTEVINILRNLIFLGVPIPSGFLKILISYLKNNLLKNMLSENLKIQEYKDDINDMINYQVLSIPSKEIQTLLEIKCTEWGKTIEYINNHFINDDDYVDKDLLYYKIMALINSTIALIDQKWEESNFSNEIFKNLNNCHKQKLFKSLETIKDICYSTDTLANKKRQIISRILMGLYQTIIDVQKCQTRLIPK